MLKRIVGGVAACIVCLTLLICAFGSWGTINAGHRGIVVRMGRITGDIKGEGFYTKTPWLDSIWQVDCRVQKEQVETEGASRDLQSVRTVVALNLSVDPNRCTGLFQNYGGNFLDSFVAPAMQESVKAIIAQYTAEELITKREHVREAIATLIAAKLNPVGIRTDALNIVNFQFSDSFNHAIEAKVTAEQNALAAKNLLAQKEFEAKQAVATAKGKAEAMQIETQALQGNPQILQLRALEKWDGALPRVSGGAVPFISVAPEGERR